MLKPTSLIMGAGLGQDVACVTDGRFSGGYVMYLLFVIIPISDPSFLYLFFSYHTLTEIKKTCYSSHGFCIGHVVPEAQAGGPIALVQDGDIIAVDAIKNVIELRVSSGELEKRRATWVAPPLKVSQGALYKYIKVVTDASHGCVTDA
jgi:dihydroxy-acid dehydratase